MKHLNLLIAILFSCCLFLVDTSIVDAKIVFVIDRDIYVMEDDGTKRRRLTKNTAPTRDKAPDGRRMARGSLFTDTWRKDKPRGSCLL